MPRLPRILEKIGSSDQGKKEYFWALLVWEESVKSAIWVVEEGKTKVVILGSRQEWSGKESKDLLHAVDKSFSTCAERFEGLGEEPENAA